MKIRVFLAVVMMAATSAFGAGPDDVLGLWNTEGDESRLEIFRCGAKFCVKIAWLKEPNYTDPKEGPVGAAKVDRNNPDPALKNRAMLGLQIMEGFTAIDGEWWEDGIIYNPDNGKSYRGRLRLVSSEKLELRGYIGISLFGSTYVLTRKQEAASKVR